MIHGIFSPDFFLLSLYQIYSGDVASINSFNFPCLYNSDFYSYLVYFTQGRQPFFFPREQDISMVCGGVRHDRSLTFRSDIHVGTRLGKGDTVQLYDGGIRIPVRVFCDCARPASIVLQAETYFHLQLSRTAIRILVIQNRCRILYNLKNTGCLPENVPCDKCASGLCF